MDWYVFATINITRQNDDQQIFERNSKKNV